MCYRYKGCLLVIPVRWNEPVVKLGQQRRTNQDRNPSRGGCQQAWQPDTRWSYCIGQWSVHQHNKLARRLTFMKNPQVMEDARGLQLKEGKLTSDWTDPAKRYDLHTHFLKETTKPLMVYDREKQKSMVQTSRFQKRTLECKYFLVLIDFMKIRSLEKHNIIKSDLDQIGEGKT